MKKHILFALITLVALCGFSFSTLQVEAAGADGPPPIDFEHVPGEVLVKFKDGVPALERANVHAKLGTKVVSSIPRINVQLVRGIRGQSAEALMKVYAKHPKVEYVEPNGLFHIDLTPYDPRFPELYGLDNTGQTGGTADADIDAPEAWDRQTGSLNVVVADIDTGVDYNHEDLAANIWTNPGEIPGNWIDDDGNGYIDDYYGWDFANNDNDPMDDHGHGTHTAGTIAAVGDNGIGVAGVAWQAQIMPLKFITVYGYGTFVAAAQSIIYAADMGAQVSSNSWGCGGCFSQVTEDAISYANTKGMLFVAAAGNGNLFGMGLNNDSRIYSPCTADSPNVLCVAATDHNDNKAGFSNYGPATVDLGAPGVGILSTVPEDGAACCSDPSGYKHLSGTSMATPHAAGAAALLLSQFPGLSPGVVKNALIGSVDPIPALDGITVSGGRLNVNNALDINFIIAITPESQVIGSGDSPTFTISVQSVVDFSSPVTLSLDSPDPTITGSFSVNPVTPEAGGSAESVLSISTTEETTRGTYILTINAADGLGEVHSTTVTLNVFDADFSVSENSASGTIAPDGSKNYYVHVGSLDGYSGPVTLSMTYAVMDEPGPQGRPKPKEEILWEFATNPVTVPVDGYATSQLTVTATRTIQLEDYTLTIEGTDGVKTRSTTAALSVIDVDLVMSAVSGPASAVTGGEMVISHTVVNEGTDDTLSGSSYFTTNFYLSDDANITQDDIKLASQYHGNLAPGASSSGNTTAHIPNDGTIPPGTYYIGAIADYNYLIPETDEANNNLAGNTIEITIGPDLVMTQVSGPPSAGTGEMITVSTTALNQGAAPSGFHWFDAGIYLSEDQNITVEDTYIGKRSYNLDPGESSSGDANGRIPGSIPPGTYYIGAIADYSDVVIESNEANNGLAGNTIEITSAWADLVMTELSGPSSAITGGRLDVSGTVTNLGSVTANNFYVGLYLSQDQDITTGDIFLWQTYISGLGGGLASRTVDLGTTLPIDGSVPPGTYYIGAIADYDNRITEGDETNNALAAGDTVEITIGPDLTMTEVSGPSCAATGERLTVQTTVFNPSTVTVSNFVNGIYLSEDQNITTGDIYLFSTPSGYVQPGTSQTRSFEGTVPNDGSIAPGTYYLGAITDHDDSVMESDEANNAVAGDIIETITVGVCPPVTQEWSAGYNGPGNDNDSPGRVLVSNSGTVYVAGSSTDSDYDMHAIAYDPEAGGEIWSSRFDSRKEDQTMNAALDDSGNIYLTGSSRLRDGSLAMRTVKFDSMGNEEFSKSYDFDDGDDVGTAVAADSSGNSYVAGYSFNGTDNDYVIIMYDDRGRVQWTARYDSGGDDRPTAIALDYSGNIYVTGSNYVTVKYDPSGNQLWDKLNAVGHATDMAIEDVQNGDIFVTGTTSSGDCTTIKYQSSGYQQWTRTFPCGYGNAVIGLDGNGNSYVSAAGKTVKYNSYGSQMWIVSRSYDAEAQAVDTAGNVYVTGSSSGDYATLKYDTLGVEEWTINYDSGGPSDTPVDIALDDNGGVYVTGSVGNNYVTVKYQNQ